eukprot:12467147-Alexandrium_andersonii.AAC.1
MVASEDLAPGVGHSLVQLMVVDGHLAIGASEEGDGGTGDPLQGGVGFCKPFAPFSVSLLGKLCPLGPQFIGGLFQLPTEPGASKPEGQTQLGDAANIPDLLEDISKQAL